MDISKVKFDCKYFRGDIPCISNKTKGFICDKCEDYTPISIKILIIKLGAIGDVIRTTPLIIKYRDLYKNCQISWLTKYPDILPHDDIDKIYNFDFISTYIITHQQYDIAINLDKDFEACALLNDVFSKQKFGYTLKDGHIALANPAAEHKFLTGLFDNISIKNKKSYLDEIFEICGMSFNNEQYLLPLNSTYNAKWNKINELANNRKIIGLNTGCGIRWLTRLWPDSSWIELINKLKENNYFPIVLGGMDEDIKNSSFSSKTGVYYPGIYTLTEFIAILNHCDVIVSAVSMTMHIAMGLHKPLVLFNNIFNKNEFYLYNNGVILEPETGCDCYYGEKCKRERHCMLDLKVDTVYNNIVKLIK